MLFRSPSLQEKFAIYRKIKEIEAYIKDEEIEAKEECTKLAHVIKFEELMIECQRSIEGVANYQIEFWAQVITEFPDLNILNELGNKIYSFTKKVDQYWEALCEINSSHCKALTLYGNYMLEIKNNMQIGYDLLDKYILI